MGIPGPHHRKMLTTLVSSLVLFFAVGLVTPCFIQAPPSNPPSPPPPPPPPACSPAPVPSDWTCKCGDTSSNRIVGGVDATPNEYPWQVALKRNGQNSPFCGGTLIDSRTVLTAAHCRTSTTAFKVVLGDHDVTKVECEEKTVSVSSWTNHPNYNSGNQDNDFAILTLSEDVQFSPSILPACLPSGTNFDGKEATVTGWGTLYSGGPQPSKLQEVDVNIMSNTQCKGTIYSDNQITENMMCATDSGKDSCQGDSGGPLVSKEGASYSVVGVVSWGYGCAQANAPGVYSRVTAQQTWIKDNMKGLNTCPRA